MSHAEHQREWIKTLVLESAQVSKTQTDASTKLVVSVIRGAFALNGSAAITVLAKQEALTCVGKTILQWGSVGAAMSILAAIFFYVSRRIYQARLERLYDIHITLALEGNLGRVSLSKTPKWCAVFSSLAWVFVAASIFTFFFCLRSLFTLL